MTEQEQIEEMISTLAASNNPFVDVPVEIMPQIAKALYNAGYRKSEEVRKETAKELAELEDKIMNGTLVELPCKVGDTVYCVEYFCDYKGCSSNEQMFCCGCSEMIERERRKEKFVISKKKFRLQDLDRVGKTLFPTEEAAEARLKKLKEEQK